MGNEEFNDKISFYSKLRELLLKVKSKGVLSDLEIEYLLSEGLACQDKGEIQLTEKGDEKIEEISRKISVLEFYNSHPYIRPAVTVDGIIFYGNKLVLIRRGNEPYKGMYAFPGGYVNYNERVEDAFLREMKEEIGVQVYNWKLFTVLSEPGRDPRGHTISIVFDGTVLEEPKAGDDASEILLTSVQDALKIRMAFDHQEVLKKFIQCRSLPH